jgi:hypothetical protein
VRGRGDERAPMFRPASDHGCVTQTLTHRCAAGP